MENEALTTYQIVENNNGINMDAVIFKFNFLVGAPANNNCIHYNYIKLNS